MQMDILNFGTAETRARFVLEQGECAMLMEACAALREARFPGLLDRLPHHFDEDDLAKVVGSEEQASEAMAILELEQTFHQSLHLFPAGHHHHDHDD